MKEGWKLMSLCSLTDKCTNIKWDKSDFKQYNYIDLTAVDRESHTINTTEKIDVINAPSRARQIVKNNDILVATTRPTLRRIALVSEKNDEDICSTGFCVLRPKKEILSKYLFFLLCTDFFYIYLEKYQTGANYPAVTDKIVKAFCVPVPPLSEQQRIVEYLDSAFAKIDALKAKAKENLDNAQALFQAALNEMMSPKEGWEEKTLGEVGSFKRGGNFSKKDFVDSGFPCLHYGQIHMKLGTVTNKHLSSVPEEMVKPERCAHKGDLVIAITSEDDAGSCKCTAWMGDYNIYVGGHTAIYTHTLNAIYMSYYFQSPTFQKEKLQYTHGFKVVEINPKDIAKISIAYPNESEQLSIVNKLDKIKEKLTTMQQNYNSIIQNSDALKQALLKQIFE